MLVTPVLAAELARASGARRAAAAATSHLACARTDRNSHETVRRRFPHVDRPLGLRTRKRDAAGCRRGAAREGAEWVTRALGEGGRCALAAARSAQRRRVAPRSSACDRGGASTRALGEGLQRARGHSWPRRAGCARANISAARALQPAHRRARERARTCRVAHTRPGKPQPDARLIRRLSEANARIGSSWSSSLADVACSVSIVPFADARGFQISARRQARRARDNGDERYARGGRARPRRTPRLAERAHQRRRIRADCTPPVAAWTATAASSLAAAPEARPRVGGALAPVRLSALLILTRDEIESQCFFMTVLI